MNGLIPQKLNSNIVYAKKVGKNHIAMLDEDKVLQVYEVPSGELKAVKKSKLAFMKGDIGRSFRKLDVANNGALLAVCDDEKKTAKVIDLNNKKLLFEIDWHQGIVETVALDGNERYAVTGGQDGKVCIWSLRTGRLVNTVPGHKDFITTLSFSKDGRYLATGSFDKRIKIKDIGFNKSDRELLGAHEGYIKFIEFMNGNRLLSIDSKGNIIMWSLETSDVISYLKKIPDEPVGYAFYDNYSVLLTAARDKNIYMHDLHTFKMTKIMRIEEGIASFHYFPHKGCFIIGTNSSSILRYSLTDRLKEIDRRIEKKQYTKAYKMVESMRLLQYSKQYEKLEEIWDATCNWAYKLLEMKKGEKIEALFAPFMGVNEKSSFYAMLKEQFRAFEQFRKMAKKKKYSVVYSVAKQHPALRDTKTFKSIEQDFKERLEEMKLSILAMKVDTKEVDKTFHDYKGIPEKSSMISSILKNSKAIEAFRHKFDNQEYQLCYGLIKTHPFLKELVDYEKLENLKHKIYDNAMMFYEEGDYKKCLASLADLEKFPEYHEEAVVLKRKVNRSIDFLLLLEGKKYDEMLTMVQMHEYLTELSEFKEFKLKFDAVAQQAEYNATKGSVKEIQEVLKEYWHIDFFTEKIGELLAVAYIQQLYLLIRKNHDKKELLLKVLQKYIFMFGYDLNMEVFMGRIKEKYSLEYGESQIQKVEPSYAKWRRLTLPKFIYQ